MAVAYRRSALMRAAVSSAGSTQQQSPLGTATERPSPTVAVAFRIAQRMISCVTKLAVGKGPTSNDRCGQEVWVQLGSKTRDVAATFSTSERLNR